MCKCLKHIRCFTKTLGFAMARLFVLVRNTFFYISKRSFCKYCNNPMRFLSEQRDLQQMQRSDHTIISLGLHDETRN